METNQALEELRKYSNKKFKQSFDLAITLKNIDMKRPESKLSKQVNLPHGRGKDVKVCIISDSLKDAQLNKRAIEELESNKSKAKKVSKEYDFFLCEAPLMVTVGKILGRYLGPYGKMPQPFVPGTNIETIKEQLKKSVKIKLKDSPVLHCIVGTEQMTNDQIKANVEKVVEEVKKSLPVKSQIKSVWLKLTMSPAVKLDVKV